MRIVVVVVLAGVSGHAAARPAWRDQILGAPENLRPLEPAPAPALVYQTHSLRDIQPMLDQAMASLALRTLAAVIRGSDDPREVCRAQVLTAHALGYLRDPAGERAGAIWLAAQLWSRPSHDDCRREADALIGTIAIEQEAEGHQLDPITFVPLWNAEASIATTAARRAAALHDRARDFWRHASRSGACAAPWRAAAAAAEEAVVADPTDLDMVTRAAEAHWNATLCAWHEP